jgi:predicted nucleic acid-binding protein
MQKYEAQGLGWMDALIVATAQKAGLLILTRDAKLARVLADEARFEVYAVTRTGTF